MTGRAPASVVIFALDVVRVSAFYEVTAALERRPSETGFATLNSPAIDVIVHRVPDHVAASFTISDPPRRREDTPIKIGFTIDSLARVRDVAKTAGGVLDSSEHEFEHEGWRWCDGHDPEGNVVQFRERVATIDGM